MLDLSVIVLLLLFACAVQEGLWLATAEGVYNPYKSDVEEYSGRLASLKYPENFRRDTMFGHEAWSTSFPNLQVALGQLFPAGDNFNWALMRQTAPLVVVFYLGFYIFGSCLFKSRAVGLLLSCAMGLPDITGFGTFWGICTQAPVPRTFFDALLPFFLLFAFFGVKRPRWRPPVLLCAGCMAWTHTVSTLVMGGAWFVVYLFVKPPAWGWGKQMGNLALCSLLFLLPVVVFILPSLMAGSGHADDPVFREMFQKNFMQRFGLPWDDFMGFCIRYTLERPLIPLALLGVLATFFSGSSQLKRICLICLYWLAGIIICAVGINWLEQAVAERLNRLSILHQLIRGLRFCVPVFYILMACGIGTLFEHLKKGWRICATVAIFLFLTIGIYPYLGRLAYYAGYWLSNTLDFRVWYSEMFDRQTAAQRLRRDAILALKERVPGQDLVFSNTGDPAIRYLGLRSLDYTQTDGAHLYFQYDASACRRWLDNMEALETPTGYVEAWRKSPAEWLLTDRPEDEELLRPLGAPVWRNDGYMLLKKANTQ